jgi:deferrochelatase/peroxidase EfeB
MLASSRPRAPELCEVHVNLGEVQAVVTGLCKCSSSRHLIFRFGDCDGARAFIGELAQGITMADVQLDSVPDPLLNIGIAFNGLGALGVDTALLAEFDAVYRTGPDARALGDVPGSRSDPAGWWEGRFNTEDVHCVVHIYVRSDKAAQNATEMVRKLARRGGLTELIPRRDGTVLEARSLGGAKLHFGYTDGISHPDICWNDVPVTPTQVDFRNFLLGYSTPGCPSTPDDGPAADLVRDSTYGAFRWLYQDVAAFNLFLRTQGPRLFPSLATADAEELLAAKMMGRWRDGTPLVLSPDRPDSQLTTSNDFSYATQDPDGHRCPFSAHIRVVNPRDTPLDPIVEGVPQILRRGMPYGPPLQGSEDDGADRGIVGIFLCADLLRQFYTLTDWVKQNDFSPVYDSNRRTQDALIGNRAVPGASAKFTLPGQGGSATVKGLPDFVHTKGTAFLLYPGKATLAALSKAAITTNRTPG